MACLIFKVGEEDEDVTEIKGSILRVKGRKEEKNIISQWTVIPEQGYSSCLAENIAAREFNTVLD
jgi:hypothetical protein